MSNTDEQLDQPLEETGESSYLGNLSDEELLALDESTPVVAEPPVPPVEELEPPEDPEPQPVIDPVPTEQTPEVNAPAETDPSSIASEPPEATPKEVEHPPKEEAEPPKAPEANTEAQAFFDAVTAPFKANGHELKITNAKDVIALMQQGANYAKKMASLKPALQVHRTLEKAGLLDPEKIGFLIDLHNGKPEAISKLAQDHGIDLYSMDAKAEDYVPQARMVSDREVQVSSTVNDLSSNPNFDSMFNTLNTWDMESQQKLLDNPEMLYAFQDHKDAGLFDQIVGVVEQERMLGRLRGVSTLDAYKLVGDSLFGGQQPQATQVQPLAQSPVAPVAQAPIVATPTPIADPRTLAKQANVNQKRQAAAAPRKVAQAQVLDDFNPLAVSDEDIDKILASQH